MDRLVINGPIWRSDHFGDGNHLSYASWRDGRTSNCRINGDLVSPVAFRKFQHDHKRKPNKMTLDRLRWNLKRYIGAR